ncbi:MAG: lysophospholipid acyltransferase family protein [Cyanobacteria bacterium J06560_2]
MNFFSFASQPAVWIELWSAIESAGEGLRANGARSERLDGWSLAGRDPQVLARMMPLMKWFYDYYYRVSTAGWHHIPTDEPVMFVGSHNGGLAAPDMHMMLFDWCDRFGLERPLYGLMSPKVWDAVPAVARTAAQMGAVRAHPKMAIAALNQKANIAVYPGGIQDVFRPYTQRHRIYFHGRKGFIKLALKKGVPIVPMISYGAHSTFVVLGDMYPQMKVLHEMGLPWALNVDPEAFPIYLGLPWGLAFGPLPHIPPPVKIHTRICEPIHFERTGAEAARDGAYVEDCFQRVKVQMQRSLDCLVAECQN